MASKPLETLEMRSDDNARAPRRREQPSKRSRRNRSSPPMDSAQPPASAAAPAMLRLGIVEGACLAAVGSRRKLQVSAPKSLIRAARNVS